MINQIIIKLIDNAGQEASQAIPFGHDYRQLNKLAFLREKLAQVSNEINILDSEFESIAEADSNSFDKLKELHGSIKGAIKLKSTQSLNPNEEKELESTLHEEQALFLSHCCDLNVSTDNAEKRLELEEQLNLINAELTEAEFYFRGIYDAANVDISALSTAVQNLEAAMTVLELAEVDDNFDALAEAQDDALRIVRDLLHSTSNEANTLIAEANALIKKLSLWQKVVFQQYVAHLATLDDKTSTFDKFLTFLLKKGNEFLPRKYIAWGGTIPAEQKFPSSGSERDRHASGYAHFQPCTGNYAPTAQRAGLLASCAPPEEKKAAGVTQGMTDLINAKRLQKFLSMLFDDAVEHLIELGANKNGVRLDYRSVTTGEFISKFNEEKSILTVTNTDSGEIRRIDFTHIPVDDQKALNLSNDQLEKLLAFYKKSTESVVLAHCDSGVGRTGQTALLLATLNFLSNNPQLHKKLSLFIDSVINENVIDLNAAKKLIGEVYGAMARLLNQLRRVRYSVEQPEQFLSSFAQLLLLIATEKQYSHVEIDALREKLNPVKPTQHVLPRPNSDISMEESRTYSTGDSSSVFSSPITRPGRLATLDSFSMAAAAAVPEHSAIADQEESADLSSKSPTYADLPHALFSPSFRPNFDSVSPSHSEVFDDILEQPIISPPANTAPSTSSSDDDNRMQPVTPALSIPAQSTSGQIRTSAIFAAYINRVPTRPEVDTTNNPRSRVW